MAGKRRQPMSKKKIIRHDAPEKSGKSAGPRGKPPEREKPRLPERIKEKDSGLGVLKWVAGLIITLVVVSAVLFNRAGGRDAMRGDKMVGESCKETVECEKGTICYAYKEARRRCMKTCAKERPCDPGFTCVSSATQKRRKGIRVTDVCVEDGKI
jgi:hypothetical protein